MNTGLARDAALRWVIFVITTAIFEAGDVRLREGATAFDRNALALANCSDRAGVELRPKRRSPGCTKLQVGELRRAFGESS